MFGAMNMTTVPQEVTLNMGKTMNFVCNSKANVAKKLIEPNKVETLMHVRRENLKDGMLLDPDFRFC